PVHRQGEQIDHVGDGHIVRNVWLYGDGKPHRGGTGAGTAPGRYCRYVRYRPDDRCLPYAPHFSEDRRQPASAVGCPATDVTGKYSVSSLFAFFRACGLVGGVGRLRYGDVDAGDRIACTSGRFTLLGAVRLRVCCPSATGLCRTRRRLAAMLDRIGERLARLEFRPRCVTVAIGVAVV